MQVGANTLSRVGAIAASFCRCEELTQVGATILTRVGAIPMQVGARN